MPVSQESLNNLDLLRKNTEDLLSEQKLSASKIVTVTRNSRPARLLSFDYYGTSQKAQDLIDINANVNTPYFQGDIKILTE